MKALDPKYPQLAKVENGNLVTEVKLLRHSRIEHDILELSGGSGNLGNLVGRYEKAVYRYAHRPVEHPVIVLIDNDSGSDPVFGAMKQHNVAVSLTTTLSFYHVCFNLYVVKTPEIGAKGTSCIEDLFDAAFRAIKLDGKTLSLDKKYDNKLHYGKADFAEHVVRPNFAKINFDGFRGLLDRLVSVLNDYRSKA